MHVKSFIKPQSVGRLKHQRAMAGALEQDVFIGNKAVNEFIFTYEKMA
jgi:hypothetical protein